MNTVSTNIRIDTDVKNQSTKLLKGLGLSLSEAVNMFLHQTILHNGLPFEVKYPEYSEKVLVAAEEAKKISSDSSVKSYSDVKVMFKDLDE